MNDSRKTKAQLIAEKKETSLRLKQVEKKLKLANEHWEKKMRLNEHQITETVSALKEEVRDRRKSENALAVAAQQ